MDKSRKDAPLPIAGFVLNVDKAPGWTSHDAVQRVRRILQFRKVGHTGTLDPYATGVLLCCVGKATKLSNALMGLPKEYTGWLRWGLKTDSGDATGKSVERSETPCPSMDALSAAAGEFVGEILQTPPMVSALKHEGRRLYKLAREGVTVERKPRNIRISSFEILQREGDRARFRVACSRGTYIRVLVEDLALKLGGLAVVDELCRTKVGTFDLSTALSMADDDLPTREDLLARAIPMGRAVGHLPGWRVPAFWAGKVRRGQAPPWVVLDLEKPPAANECGRLIGRDDELLALAEAVPSVGPADRDWTEAYELKLTRVI